MTGDDRQSVNLDQFLPAYGKEFPYALDNRLMLNWYPRRIMELAHGTSVLELGLGHGFTSALFAERFPRHVVIEGSTSVIEQFRRQHGSDRPEIVHGLFEEFETDERFDVIVMGFVLEHVDNPDLVLRKYRAYAAEGGSVFVTVPNCAALNKRLGLHAGLLSDLMELSEGDRALGHRRLYTVDTLRAAVEAAGYEVRRCEGIFLKPLSTAQLEQLHLDERILEAMLRVGIDYPELCVGLLMQLACRS